MKRDSLPVAAVWAGVLLLGTACPALAQQADPGRLFFTPAQRAELEAARARTPATAAPGTPAATGETPASLRYDGLLMRSDGRTTRWVDGKPQRDGAGVSGLKPGQIRADGRVFEPYQVLRPRPSAPAAPGDKESTP
jgi:hypothetical protein